MKAIKALLILGILFSGALVLADQQKEYSSYPIIFVHGYNARELPPENGWDRWKEAKKNIEKYFYEKDEYKYSGLDTKEKYFPTVNFGYQKTGLISRNGDIPTIASHVLLPQINWALDNCFPVHYSESERKVIIVAHSMGGLVVRSLLTQFPDYQKKIDRVVFIDVPHLGSPYASAVWMIDKEAKEKLPPLIREYSTFYSKLAGALRLLRPPPGIEYTFAGAPYIFNHISWELQGRLNRDKNFLWLIENIAGTDPDGYAIDKMRLPFQSEYHNVVTGTYKFRYVSVPIDIVYGSSETFLGSTNLAIPSKFKIISGKVPSNFGEEGYLGYKAFEYVTGILFSYREGFPLGFSFERGYTLEDTKTTGDGVVPKLSQETVGDKVGADYPIIAAHGQAPDAWQTILQAIDDKPVIEDMYARYKYGIQEGPTYTVYVVVKVKDYLLADVEISYLKVDGVPVDPVYLREFDDGTGHYKPYVKGREDKEFLKERKDPDLLDSDWKPVTLFPGEFYVKLDLSADAPHIVDIEMKNPSSNPPVKKSLVVSPPKLVGSWAVDVQTGYWMGFSSETPEIVTRLFCLIYYIDGQWYISGSTGPYGGLYGRVDGWHPMMGYPSGDRIAHLYKIDLPQNLNIDYIDITLKRSWWGGKTITYYAGIPYEGEPNSYPPDITAITKIDYSFNSPIGHFVPEGEENLLYEEIGGNLEKIYERIYYWTTDDGQQLYSVTKGIKTSLPKDTIVKRIPVNSAADAVWLSIYPFNIQSMAAQLTPYAVAALHDPENIWEYTWQIGVVAGYIVEKVYFHEVE